MIARLLLPRTPVFSTPSTKANFDEAAGASGLGLSTALS